MVQSNLDRGYIILEASYNALQELQIQYKLL